MIAITSNHVHLVHKDVFIHGLQNLSHGSIAAVASRVEHANSDTVTADSRALPAHAGMSVGKLHFFGPWYETLLAENNLENTVTHVVVSALGNALDFRATLCVPCHITRQGSVLVAMSSD